jgi:hypothetical protein
MVMGKTNSRTSRGRRLLSDDPEGESRAVKNGFSWARAKGRRRSLVSPTHKLLAAFFHPVYRTWSNIKWFFGRFTASVASFQAPVFDPGIGFDLWPMPPEVNVG